MEVYFLHLLAVYMFEALSILIFKGILMSFVSFDAKLYKSCFTENKMSCVFKQSD